MCRRFFDQLLNVWLVICWIMIVMLLFYLLALAFVFQSDIMYALYYLSLQISIIKFIRWIFE